MYLKTWWYKLSKKNHIQYIEKRLKNIKKSNKSVNKDLKTKNGQKKLLNIIFEEIIVKKFLNLIKTIISQIQDAKQTPSSTNRKLPQITIQSNY